MDRLANVSRVLDNGRNLLANGNLPVEIEVDLRRTSALLGQKVYEATGNTARLHDAVQHAQAVVRLLQSPSAQRARDFDQLAFLEMSTFEITNSMKTLDDSIAHSKQARDEALAANDPQLAQIYHNLGYSLSHRALVSKSDRDIDEAIICGREVLHRTDPADHHYYKATINLANRLQTRYNMHRQLADVDEATALLEQTLETSRFSPEENGAALILKAKLLYDRYEDTKDLQNIDDAIATGQQGLASIPSDHELRKKVLPLFANMCNTKYQRNGDSTSLDSALDYWKQTVQTTPQSYQSRPLYISKYLGILRESVNASSDVCYVQGAIRNARSLREEIPREHTKRNVCNISLVKMLSKQYLLTRQVEHLNDVVWLLDAIVDEYNSTLDISQPKVTPNFFQTLKACVTHIDEAELNRSVKAEITEQIYRLYLPVHESKNHLEGMLVMLKELQDKLEALTTSLDKDDTSSKEVAKAEAGILQGTEIGKLSQKGKMAQNRAEVHRDDYIDPIFGHKYLAMDPHNNRIMLTMEGVMKPILGYGDDYVAPTSWAEFEAQEAQLERQSFEKDKREGKDPNPKLCRMCRFTTPLVPSQVAGFSWNTKLWVPFGSYYQLLTRKHCSICRMILALITVEGTDRLHPRLAQIDSEVQGTQFHIQILPSGEKMLGVEYGMISVGALRILTPDNLLDALRQKPPAEKCTTILENTSDLLSFVNESDQTMDLVQIRRWAYNCEKNHGELCNNFSHSQRYHADIPLLLIDVRNSCLVSDTSAQRYFTLSYMWGQCDIPKTLKANVKKRFERQSISQIQLPNTIRDAIALVRGLGEQFLWTDALCIVQDDLAQMEQDIPRMDIIYKKAFANIIAMSGNDAGAGLAGVTSKSRPPQLVEILPVLRDSTTLAFSSDTSAAHEKVCLVATPQPLAYAQESSMWNTRGWILQEQLLASRNIYFSRNHAYFHCNEALQGEATLHGAFESLRSKYDTKGPRVADVVNPLANLGKRSDLSTKEKIKQVFDGYSKLVELYTTRNLTKQSDILRAFSGMLSNVGEEFNSLGVSSFNASGLPVATLELALLWTPAGTLAVRHADQAVNPSSPALPTGHPPDEPQLDFPTWSWAGWIGSVDYRLTPPEKEPWAGTLIAMCYVLEPGKAARVLLDATKAVAYQKNPPDLDETFAGMKISAPSLLDRHLLVMDVPFVFGHKFTVNRTREPDYVSKSKHIHSSTAQPIVRLLDEGGRHCGILFEHFDYYKLVGHSENQWKEALESVQSFSDKLIIGISQTTDAFDRRQGFSRVEGDISLFDSDEFPVCGIGSALVNVLVLRPSRDMCCERIAVGQIHIKAWEKACPVATWVKLE